MQKYISIQILRSIRKATNLTSKFKSARLAIFTFTISKKQVNTIRIFISILFESIFSFLHQFTVFELLFRLQKSEHFSVIYFCYYWGSCPAKNQVSAKQSFSKILRLKMILSVVFYNRKIILFIMFFVIEFFLIISSYRFFWNNWIFMKHGLLFQEIYFLQLYYCFQSSK